MISWENFPFPWFQRCQRVFRCNFSDNRCQSISRRYYYPMCLQSRAWFKDGTSLNVDAVIFVQDIYIHILFWGRVLCFIRKCCYIAIYWLKFCIQRQSETEKCKCFVSRKSVQRNSLDKRGQWKSFLPWSSGKCVLISWTRPEGALDLKTWFWNQFNLSLY